MQTRVRNILASNTVFIAVSLTMLGGGLLLNVQNPEPRSTTGLLIGAAFLTWIITAVVNLSGRTKHGVLRILKYEVAIFLIALVPWSLIPYTPDSLNPWTVIETIVVLMAYLVFITLTVYVGKLIAGWVSSEDLISV